MRTLRQRYSPIFRLTAVVAMFLWLLGQTLCVQHCAKLVFAKGGQECCAKKSEGQSKTSGGKMLCGSLKMAKLEAKTLVPEAVTVPLDIFAPAAVLALPDTSVDSGLQVNLRTLPRVDFVFRPEVSLGAAFRSLAPPVLA